jgi:hypothetical protein
MQALRGNGTSRVVLRSSVPPGPIMVLAAGSRACQWLAAISRDRAANDSALSPPSCPAGAALSSTVVQTLSWPQPSSTSSTIRLCCGQSMCDAVVTCQNPPVPLPPVIGLILCWWEWPFTQRTTHPWARSSSRSSGPRTRLGAPGARRALTSDSSGWWLNRMTTGRRRPPTHRSARRADRRRWSPASRHVRSRCRARHSGWRRGRRRTKPGRRCRPGGRIRDRPAIHGSGSAPRHARPGLPAADEGPAPRFGCARRPPGLPSPSGRRDRVGAARLGRPTGQGGDVIAFADQRVRQRLVGGNSTFHLVIVVAVDRVPGQPQPGGGE